jgi:hypothetical protein
MGLSQIQLRLFRWEKFDPDLTRGWFDIKVSSYENSIGGVFRQFDPEGIRIWDSKPRFDESASFRALGSHWDNLNPKSKKTPHRRSLDIRAMFAVERGRKFTPIHC